MKLRRGHVLIATAFAVTFAVTPLIVDRNPVARSQTTESVGVERSIASGMPARQSPQAVTVAEPAPFDPPLLPTTDPADYAEAKATAAETGPEGFRSPGPEPAGAPAGNALKVKGVNRNGVQSAAATAPAPDTHGAAGAKHFVEVVNRRFFVIKKQKPKSVTTDVSLASFFDYGTQPLFHPQVAYDHRKERWIVSAEALPESPTVQRLFVAVSTTKNPNRDFNIYQFDVADAVGTYLDRPMLGFHKRAIVMTANIFDAPPPDIGTYLETNVLVLPKQAAYRGDPVDLEVLSAGPTGSLAPPIVLDGADDVFLLQSETSSDELPLWRGTRFGLSAPSISLVHDVPVPAYSIPPDAPQPGTAALLDTADARFLSASTQYGRRLWNVHTTNEIGLATPRFYEINTELGAAEQTGGFWASEDSSADFNASIAANKGDEAFVTWTSTNQTLGINAQVRFSGRIKGGRLGTIRLPGTVLGSSLTFYDPSPEAVESWGQYSSVSLDPAEYGSCQKQRRAWIVNETVKDTDVWGSRIGRIGFC